MSMDEAARSRAPGLDRLVGRNLRQLREELDLSQTDIAEGMAAAGFPAWRKATVADVERGARKVTLDELAGLSDVTERKLERFLTPDAELSSEGQRRAKVLTGKLRPQTPDGRGDVTVERDKEKLEAYLSRDLGLDVDELSELCRALYGHPDVWLERERRVTAQGFPESFERERHEFRARRGHATRAMLAEMRERLDLKSKSTRGRK